MSERLKLFITTLGVKQIEISKKLSISHSNITRYLKGARIPITVALSLQAKFSLSHRWLLNGEGPMFLKNETLDNESASLLEDYYMLDETAQDDVKKYLELHKFKRNYSKTTSSSSENKTDDSAVTISYKEKELIAAWRNSNQEDRERILIIIRGLLKNEGSAPPSNAMKTEFVQASVPNYANMFEVSSVPK